MRILARLRLHPVTAFILAVTGFTRKVLTNEALVFHNPLFSDRTRHGPQEVKEARMSYIVKEVPTSRWYIEMSGAMECPFQFRWKPPFLVLKKNFLTQGMLREAARRRGSSRLRASFCHTFVATAFLVLVQDKIRRPSVAHGGRLIEPYRYSCMHARRDDQGN